MPVDTSRRIDFYAARGKPLALLVLSILSTALSAAIAFRLLPDLPVDATGDAVGRTGLIVFGLCTVISLWRLYVIRKPTITISPGGIRDRRVAPDLIAWSAVRGISTWQILRQQVVVLAVDEAFERRLAFTMTARWMRGGYRAHGVDGIVISAQGLQAGFPTLFYTCRDYWEAHRHTG
jgi:hypothetical protein